MNKQNPDRSFRVIVRETLCDVRDWTLKGDRVEPIRDE
jgi:hypothetical protein